MEARWLRLIGPGIISVGLLATLGPAPNESGDVPWDPPACHGAGLARIVATRHTGTTASTDRATDPSLTLEPVLDATGSLAGQRLTIATGADGAVRRLALPAESFVAGPFGHVAIVGDDDGRRSRLRVLDLDAGCTWTIAVEVAVIRRATASPDGLSVFETRVDRESRADLGVWQRPMDGHAGVERVVAPPDEDGRFGRTWSTEFAWSVDADRLAIQSCGAVACRTRILDPSTGALELVADPSLGPLVGLTTDRVVSYRACRGLPCGLVAVDVRTRHRTVLSDAAGEARVIGRGAAVRVFHERFDHGARRLRGVGVDGRHASDIGSIPDGVPFDQAIADPSLPLDEVAP